MQRSIQWYLDNGFDQRTAEYFASGRRQITTVHPNEDFTLTLGFDNGEQRRLDCKPFLKAGTVFESFMRYSDFSRVYLDDTHSVCWDVDPATDSNVIWSNKVDICPDTCYMDSVPINQ